MSSKVLAILVFAAILFVVTAIPIRYNPYYHGRVVQSALSIPRYTLFGVNNLLASL